MEQNLKLSAALQSLTAEEFELALDEIQADVALTQQAVYQAHAARIRRKYKGLSPLLDLEANEENQIRTPGKIDGYRFAASIFVTVAENRKSNDFKNARLSIETGEVMDRFYEIIGGTPDELIAAQVASRSLFPGFCTGISLVFAFLIAGETPFLHQMAFGLTIFTGVLLKLAGADDVAAIRGLSTI